MCRLRTASLPHPALRLDSFLLRAPQNRKILWVGKGRNRVSKLLPFTVIQYSAKTARNHITVVTPTKVGAHCPAGTTKKGHRPATFPGEQFFACATNAFLGTYSQSKNHRLNSACLLHHFSQNTGTFIPTDCTEKNGGLNSAHKRDKNVRIYNHKHSKKVA